MKAYFFSEMPYPYVPEEVERSFGSSRIVVPNSYCDPLQMADLYNRYLDEYEYADELGLEPIDREVLALRHFEQLGRAEAALVLGITQEAGAKRYFRALKRLKDVLAALPGGSEGF